MKMLTDYNPSYVEETNFDHFRKELLELSNNGVTIGLYGGKPVECGCVSSDDCDEACVCLDDPENLIRWGFQKYVEPLKLSLSEHYFLAAIETGYIIRDSHHQLFWCETPPSKVDGIWEVQSGDMVNLNFLKCMELPFIKYEGTSWSVEQLLELEREAK